MVHRMLALIALALFPTLASTARPSQTTAPGGAGLAKGARVAVVVLDDKLPRSRMALDDLTSFLQRSLGAVVRRYPAETSLRTLEESVSIVFGASEAGPNLDRLAGEAGVRVETADLGTEGSRVRSASLGGKPVVFLAGKTMTGACHAVYSFLETE